MTAAAVVAAVIPASVTVAGGGSSRVGSGPRRPLPLPAEVLARRRSTVYGFAAVHDRGRVADRGVLRVLGWVAGTPAGHAQRSWLGGATIPSNEAIAAFVGAEVAAS